MHLLKLLCLLWLALPGYPPDQSIVLHQGGRLTLRWPLSAGRRSVRVELVDSAGAVQSQVVEGQSWSVAVRPGGYRWRVDGGVENHFTVTDEFAYRSDGRTGSPGKNGSNGGQLRLRLARGESGMELWIWDRDRQLHYVGLARRFLVSARGGDGGRGEDGLEFEEAEAARGRDGGSAGWGGTIEVVTRDAPWRQYLELDVAGGEPGAGGKGGRFYRNGVLSRGPDGRPGLAGRSGRVVTEIEP